MKDTNVLNLNAKNQYGYIQEYINCVGRATPSGIMDMLKHTGGKKWTPTVM